LTTLDVFNWLELSAVGVAIRDSLWLFPVVEAGHLLALTVLGGSVLAVDLHLLGFGLREKSVAYVVGQVRPWLYASILAMIATGVPLFLSEAEKCYFSDAFWLKMKTLPIAVVYTIALRSWIAKTGPDLGTWTGRAMAIISISLWLTVAAAGRWIGFS